MSMILLMEAQGATSIETACVDAQRVANMLRIHVKFEFNEVTCVAVPGGSPMMLMMAQQREQARMRTSRWDLKFATSDPKHPRNQGAHNDHA